MSLNWIQPSRNVYNRAFPRSIFKLLLQTSIFFPSQSYKSLHVLFSLILIA